MSEAAQPRTGSASSTDLGGWHFSHSLSCASGELGGAKPAGADEFDRIKQQRLKILLVDDVQAFRRSFAVRLRIIYRAIVEEVESATQALDMIQQGRRFDLILMDVSMPDLMGDQALKKVQDLRLGLRVVLMSAHEENRERARELNVSFLSKPVNDVALRSILLDCLKEK